MLKLSNDDKTEIEQLSVEFFSKIFHKYSIMNGYDENDVLWTMLEKSFDIRKKIKDDSIKYFESIKNDINIAEKLPIIENTVVKDYIDAKCSHKDIDKNKISTAEFLGFNKNNKPFFKYLDGWVPLKPTLIEEINNKKCWVMIMTRD